MAANGEKRTGLGAVPTGLLRPTTQPDEPTSVEPTGQGVALDAPSEPISETRAPKVRRKKVATAPNAKLEGRRLYLSEGVHFRLRIYAYQRGQKLSEAAEDLLDKALPKYDVQRSG